MAMNMMNNPQVLQSAARLLEDPAMVDQMVCRLDLSICLDTEN
jgi:hypothetical protein